MLLFLVALAFLAFWRILEPPLPSLPFQRPAVTTPQPSDVLPPQVTQTQTGALVTSAPNPYHVACSTLPIGLRMEWRRFVLSRVPSPRRYLP